MKAIAINGSPRKGWNTEKLLQEALRGAASVGAQTEIIQLYDLNYTGCKSCFGCKRKGAESCHCILKDDVTQVLEKVFSADAVFLGSPIYFGDMTGQMVSFVERLGFPLLSYDGYSKKTFDGSINAAIFYTMNAPEAYYKASMEQGLAVRAAILQRLGGIVEVCTAFDTYQFPDYAKYHAGSFDEEHKREVREKQFPKDMAKAFDIGCRLVTAKR